MLKWFLLIGGLVHVYACHDHCLNGVNGEVGKMTLCTCGTKLGPFSREKMSTKAFFCRTSTVIIFDLSNFLWWIHLYQLYILWNRLSHISVLTVVKSLFRHLLTIPLPGRTLLFRFREVTHQKSNPKTFCRSSKRMQGEVAGSCVCFHAVLCSASERMKRRTRVTHSPPCPLCALHLSHCALIRCVKHLTQLASRRLSDYW